jgi:hypothetical protein
MKAIWQRWKMFAERIGIFNARVILSLFYFTLLLPFGIMVKFFANPLSMRERPSWREKESRKLNFQEAKRQF